MNSNEALKNKVGAVTDYFARKVARLEASLLDACRSLDEPVARVFLDELIEASRAKHTADSISAELPAEPTVATYMLSTLTIQEACAALTKTGDEDMRFATGLAVARMTYAVTRLLQFDLKRRSAVYAEGDQESVARLLINLHNVDHKLYMTWHSHPGSGAGSTAPSAVDVDFHRRLESGDYPVIGAIVNRQKYVRFYSYKRPFKVLVYGRGMEVIDEHECVYKLDKFGAV